MRARVLAILIGAAALTGAGSASTADNGTSLPAYLAGSDLPATAEAERMRRLRRDYGLSADEMLAKLKRDMPGVTSGHLERWTREGAIQWLQLDGETRYFRREPSNLFRLSAEARSMRGDSQTTSPAPVADPSLRDTARFRLTDHIAQALRAAAEESTPTVRPVTMRVSHVIRVKPGVVPAGETIRCWMPFPQDYRHQRGGADLRTSPAGHRLAPSGVPMRTVYMEQPSAGDTGETVFRAEYTYVSADYVAPGVEGRALPAGWDTGAEAAPADLESRPPHLDLTPEVRALAASIVGGETDPARKARLIWLWIDENIRYVSEMEYSVMPRILDKVMAERRGDCGVHALMFIGLCRAAGVPARWQSGWVTRPGGWNMHDWAEFHGGPQLGWVPADPSAGVRKDSEDAAVRHFFFGGLDAYRMIANLDYARPFDPPKQHWPSDPIDNQRGEVEWSGGNLYYDQWDYEVRATRQP